MSEKSSQANRFEIFPRKSDSIVGSVYNRLFALHLLMVWNESLSRVIAYNLIQWPQIPREIY